MRNLLIPLALALAACSSSSGTASHDGGSDASHHDATNLPDSGVDRGDGGSDATDAFASDGATPTSALVRLANFSPDAPDLDFCVSPHAANTWTGPLLAAALGAVVLGHVTVTDAAVVIDSSTPHLRDSGNAADASAAIDASSAPDASSDAAPGPPPDAAFDTSVDASGAPPSGVPFPRLSPYVSLTPGLYDLRVVAGGAIDCTMPLFPETDDLSALPAGAVVTFAAVGDTVDQGNDPPLGLSVFSDDTAVASSGIALRFVNAVPSVAGVTFASGLIVTGNVVPYLAAAQFGAVGVDTDAGPIDSNDYVALPPIHDAIWSLINANGGVSSLVAVENASLAAGSLATVVGIGGESGPLQASIGILVCIDVPPIVAGETASCTVIQGDTGGVCPGCP